MMGKYSNLSVNSCQEHFNKNSFLIKKNMPRLKKDSNKFFSLHYIAIKCIVLCLLIDDVVSVRTSPLVESPSPYIESQRISISNLGITQFTSTTFNCLKSTGLTIDSNYIFIAVSSMNYDINAVLGIYLMQFTISVQVINANSINIIVQDKWLQITSFSISIMIFYKQFPDLKQISYSNAVLSKSTPDSYDPIRFLPTSMVAHFLRSFNGESSQIAHNIDYKVDWTNKYPGLNTSIHDSALSSFVFLQIEIKYLIVMLSLPKYEIKLYIFNQLTLSQVTAQYFSNNNQAIMGLIDFTYSPTLSNEQFQFDFNFNPINNQSQLSDNNKISRITYFMLIIKYMACPNLEFSLKGENINNNNLIQCFDQCYSNYYLQWQDYQYWCLPCNSPCLTCHSLQNCTSCHQNYSLDPTLKCVVDPTHCILSNGTTVRCSDHITGCTLCTASCLCTQCSLPYYMNMKNSSCNIDCSRDIANCELCRDSTDCVKCKQKHTLNNLSTCTAIPTEPLPCSDPTCYQCLQQNISYCVVCIQYLKNDNGSCLPISICGDGYIQVNQICDDGNLFNFDGCNSQCQVEDSWNCHNIPNRQYSLMLFFKSVCQYNPKFHILSIDKVNNKNQIAILIKNAYPNIKIWNQITSSELTQMFIFRIQTFEQAGVKGYNFKYNLSFDYQAGKLFESKHVSSVNRLLTQTSKSQESYILLRIQYNRGELAIRRNGGIIQSLNQQKALIMFDCNLSKSVLFPVSLTFETVFYLVSDDNELIQYYSSDYYDKCQSFAILSFIVGMAAILLILLPFIAIILDGYNSRAIWIMIQAVSIVQFTYFSFTQIGEINPLFIAVISSLKYIFGSSVSLIKNDKILRKHQAIYMQSYHFANNTAIPLLLVLSFVITGVIIKMIIKYKKQKIKQLKQNLSKQEVEQSEQIILKLNKYSKIFIGNFGFGFFILFLYPFYYYLFIQFKYALNQVQILDIIAIIMFFALLITFVGVYIFKFSIYTQLTNKILKYKPNKKLKNDKHQLDQQQCNIGFSIQKFMGKYSSKGIYICIYMISPLLNIISLILISDLTLNFFVIPIFSQLFLILYIIISKCLNQPNVFRQVLTQLLSIFIQLILMIRIKFINVHNFVGYQEKDFGTRAPQAIAMALFIIMFISLLYALYSIKKIRFFPLKIDWQNAAQNVSYKEFNLLQQFKTKLLLNLKDKQSDSQLHRSIKRPINKSVNQHNKHSKESQYQQDDEQDINHVQNLQNIQNSQRPFLMINKKDDKKISRKKLMSEIKKQMLYSRIVLPQSIKKLKNNSYPSVFAQSKKQVASKLQDKQQLWKQTYINQKKSPAYRYTKAKYVVQDEYNNI